MVYTNKIFLLLWKHWILTKRNLSGIVCVLITPLIVILIVTFLSSRRKLEVRKELHYNRLIIPSTIPDPNVMIVYTPANTHLAKVLSKITQNVQACINEKELIQEYRKIREAKNYTVIGALQFENRFKDQNEKSFEKVKIKIRMNSDDNNMMVHWYTNKIMPITIHTGASFYDQDYRPIPDYYGSSFLIIQNLVAQAFVSEKTDPAPKLPAVYIQRYPSPKHIFDAFSAIRDFIKFLFAMLFTYNLMNFVLMIVMEKEIQLLALMKIMGLNNWTYMAANFIYYFTIYLISAIPVMFFLTVSTFTTAMFPLSDISLLLVLFVLHGCALGCFSIFIASLLSKAQAAENVCQFIALLINLPIIIEMYSKSPASTLFKTIFSFLPGAGLVYGLDLFYMSELQSKGSQWSDLFKRNESYEMFGLGLLFVIFIIQCFLFVLLALYFNEINPGEFGVARKWTFPFTKEYWAPSETLFYVREKSTEVINDNFEEVLENLPVGVKIQNLRKMFGENISVDNLNLNMYKGHITVLLGHNGAGKTTTIAMITGVFSPTSGTIIVNGYDIRTHLSEVRKSIGVCFQHNVLLENMTVNEHLYFFCKLKNLKQDKIQDEVEMYLKVLKLEDKKNTFSMNLSGGMKRRLCIGMSLCANSEVVLLDEPTAGVDPAARRDIWTLLQEQKHNRTMLLTTHFMDEADLLGDRIAIMTSGRLNCVGSSFFLKKKYGAGYSLVLDITPNCNPDEVTNILREHISNLQIKSLVGSELTYLLDYKDSDKFEIMFSDLEDNMDDLGVNSFGISLTTLEEIFLKVGADHMKANKDAALNKIPNGLVVDLLVGKDLLLNQFKVTLWKKWILHYRSWITLLMMLLIPTLLGVLLCLMKVMNETKNQIVLEQPLPLNLKKYTNVITLFKGPSNWLNIYKLSLNGYRVETLTNIEKRILTETKNDPITAMHMYAIGAEFTKESAIAWFNGELYHSIAISLAMVLDTFYKDIFGENAKLEFENNPMPPSAEAMANDAVEVSSSAMYIAYAFLISTSLYCIPTMKERILKAKHLQIVSGLNMLIYWLATYLFDFFFFFFSILLVIIPFGICGITSDLGAFFVLCLFFGFILLQVSYFCCYLFKSTVKVISGLFLIGCACILAQIILVICYALATTDGTKDLIDFLTKIFSFLPFFLLMQGLHLIENMQSTKKICLTRARDENCANKYLNRLCCNFYDNIYSTSTYGIGLNLIIAFIFGIIIFTLLVLIDQGKLKIKCPTKNKFINNENLDYDVQEENKRIRNTDLRYLTQKYIVVVKDLSKYYHKFFAVKQLCLGLRPFECFGLLGVNGAGKTTTFKMMTGDESISKGDVFVNGISLLQNLRQVQKHVGYCPQFDALLVDLTVRETLQLFAMIRGVSSMNCKNLLEYLADEFDFYNHLNKKVKQLSGGNKRKLSTAIATIGNPPVIYLDEPSTGMDPATKRHLWNALCKLRDRGTCIVLTSHSMEECEALCTRVAIMAAGEFKCLGSIQHLKNKFAQGYALNIKLKKHIVDNPEKMKEDIDTVKTFVKNVFPGSVLKEDHEVLLSYGLMDTNDIPLSQIFGILERAKYEYNLEDYSLAQCSLEQVFLIFTTDAKSE